MQRPHTETRFAIGVVMSEQLARSEVGVVVRSMLHDTTLVPDDGSVRFITTTFGDNGTGCADLASAMECAASTLKLAAPNAGTDSFLAMFSNLDLAYPWFVLQDSSNDVVGLVDDEGDLRYNAVFDPYGNVLMTEALARPGGSSAPTSSPTVRMGHKGLFFTRFDADTLQAQLAPGSDGFYSNRNRAYSPSLGRFVQRDPNETGMTLMMGGTFGAALSEGTPSIEFMAIFGDGPNLYAYVGSNPIANADPLGLAWDPFEMVDEFVAVDSASKAAFMEKLVGSFNSALHIAKMIASVNPVFAGAMLAYKIVNGEQISLWDIAAIVPGGAVVKAFAKAHSALEKGRVAYNGINAVTRGGATAVKLGKAGEDAVRAVFKIGDKVKISINGRNRIPDGLTQRVLTEIKNVQSLSYTQQLRDFADFAARSGRVYDLFTRSTTTLSGPLREAIENGIINHRIIPGT